MWFSFCYLTKNEEIPPILGRVARHCRRGRYPDEGFFASRFSGADGFASDRCRIYRSFAGCQRLQSTRAHWLVGAHALWMGYSHFARFGPLGDRELSRRTTANPDRSWAHDDHGGLADGSAACFSDAAHFAGRWRRIRGYRPRDRRHHRLLRISDATARGGGERPLGRDWASDGCLREDIGAARRKRRARGVW